MIKGIYGSAIYELKVRCIRTLQCMNCRWYIKGRKTKTKKRCHSTTRKSRTCIKVFQELHFNRCIGFLHCPLISYLRIKSISAFFSLLIYQLINTTKAAAGLEPATHKLLAMKLISAMPLKQRVFHRTTNSKTIINTLSN